MEYGMIGSQEYDERPQSHLWMAYLEPPLTKIIPGASSFGSPLNQRLEGIRFPVQFTTPLCSPFMKPFRVVDEPALPSKESPIVSCGAGIVFLACFSGLPGSSCAALKLWPESR